MQHHLAGVVNKTGHGDLPVSYATGYDDQRLSVHRPFDEREDEPCEGSVIGSAVHFFEW